MSLVPRIHPPRPRHWVTGSALNHDIIIVSIDPNKSLKQVTCQSKPPEHWLFTIYMGKPVGPRSTANGTQNSGLVNFVPESRLPFVQISWIYQKTTAKAWTRYERWLFLPFLIFRCSEKCSDGTTQKVVFHLLSKPIFRKILVHGKQPLLLIQRIFS